MPVRSRACWLGPRKSNLSDAKPCPVQEAYMRRGLGGGVSRQVRGGAGMGGDALVWSRAGQCGSACGRALAIVCRPGRDAVLPDPQCPSRLGFRRAGTLADQHPSRPSLSTGDLAWVCRPGRPGRWLLRGSHLDRVSAGQPGRPGRCWLVPARYWHGGAGQAQPGWTRKEARNER